MQIPSHRLRLESCHDFSQKCVPRANAMDLAQTNVSSSKRIETTVLPPLPYYFLSVHFFWLVQVHLLPTYKSLVGQKTYALARLPSRIISLITWTYPTLECAGTEPSMIV